MDLPDLYLTYGPVRKLSGYEPELLNLNYT